MKRSRSGRGAFGLLERVKTRFGWNRPSHPQEQTPSEGPTSRRASFLAAGAVITVPAIIASLIVGSGGGTPTQPKVTKVLESIPDFPRGTATAKRKPSDAPVDAASVKKKKGAITFEFKRGSRIPVGYIKIPAIGVETKFFDGVVKGAVKRGPGHWPGTPWPGEVGNAVFAGHRTTFTKPFADLDLLKKGQLIRAQVRNGPRTTYKVFRKTVVRESKYADFVLKQPRKNNVRMITLFACTPKGFRTHRIVVQAKAVPRGTARGPSQKREGAMGGLW